MLRLGGMQVEFRGGHRINLAAQESSLLSFLLDIWQLYSTSTYHPWVEAMCVSGCPCVVLTCGEGEAVSPCQTDGYQRGPRELSAALQRSQEVKLQSSLSSLLFLPQSLYLSSSLWAFECVFVCSFTPFALLQHVCISVSVIKEQKEPVGW